MADAKAAVATAMAAADFVEVCVPASIAGDASGAPSEGAQKVTSPAMVFLPRIVTATVAAALSMAAPLIPVVAPSPSVPVDLAGAFLVDRGAAPSDGWVDAPVDEAADGDAMAAADEGEGEECPAYPSEAARRFVASCERQLADWDAGLVPADRYWSRWDPEEEPWCSEFVGWCLEDSGLVPGETMPAQPDCADAYYWFYLEHPELAEMHENDGTYLARPGDIVLFSGLSHTEMVSEAYDGGTSWCGVSGGGSVVRTRQDMSNDACWLFITLVTD